MSKNVFVTGSSAITGKGIALEFARAGYNVGITYNSNIDGALDAVAQIEAMGQKAACYKLDTRDIEGCRKTIAQFAEDFGGIDVMVNNTGLTINEHFLKVDMDTFQKIWETNMRGCYFCGQAAARDMVKRGTKGVIINLSSLHLQGTWPGDTMYAVTKRAIQKLTECEAYDLAEYGIRAVCLAPGWVEMGWGEKSEQAKAFHELMCSRFPIHRMVTPAELGRCAVFLSSESAGYITGATLMVDGGALLPVLQENYYLPQVDYYPAPVFTADAGKADI